MQNLFTLEKINNIFYYRTYDKDGNRKRFTTKKSKKSEALLLIQERIKNNTLDTGGISKVDTSTFANYSKDFWTENCPYCQMKELLGRPLQKSTIKDRRSALISKVYPIIGNLPLTQITTKTLSDLQLTLFKTGYSSSSIKKLLSIISPIFETAVDEEIIKSNPMKRLKTITVTTKNTKDAFNLEEVGMLFSGGSENWSSYYAYLACLVSAMTGMRFGEILALRIEDIEFPSLSQYAYIHVEHSWNHKEKVLTNTKTGKSRIIPVTRELAVALYALNIEGSNFIFSINGNYPVYQTYIAKHLKRRMKDLGIPFKRSNGDKLTFHSFRHFANSLLIQAGHQSEVVRSIIGHSSDKMTEHYFHSSKENLHKIADTMKNII